MAEKVIQRSQDGTGSALERFRNGSLTAQARKLTMEPDAWIATEDLIAAIVANAREPMPDVLIAHLRRRLERTAMKRRGRKAPSPSQRLYEHCVRFHYERLFAQLQRRQMAQGLVGWPSIRDADWWQGPPSERAARMIAAKAKTVSWRHILNLVSKARS